MLHEEFRKKIEEVYFRKPNSIKKADFDIFHFSVQQKIWQTDYYYQRIRGIYDSKKFESEFVNVLPLFESIEGSQTQSTATKREIDKEKLARYCSLYLDGYLSNISSIFDSLAQEVNTIFRLISPEKDIYFSAVLSKLGAKNPKSVFLKFISKERKKRWWSVWKDFRNASVHENILATNIETSTNVASRQEVLTKIPVPDNPKKRPFTYKKNKELKSFVEELNDNVALVLEQSYKRLIKDLSQSGKLPIVI